MKLFKCPECGQLVAEGMTELTYNVGEIKVTIQNVPALVCPNEHAYVDGYVAENANRLVDRVVEDLTSFSKKLPSTGVTPRHVMIAA